MPTPFQPSNRAQLIVDPEQFNSAELYYVPCFILAEPYLLQITQGNPPYTITSIRLFGEEPFHVTLELEEQKTELSRPFQAQTLKRVHCSIPLRKLLETLRQDRKEETLTLTLYDAERDRTIIAIPTDITPLFSTIQKLEKIEAGNAAIKIDPERAERIRVEFQPPIVIQTLEPRPQIEIMLDDQNLEIQHRLVESSEDTSPALYKTYLQGFPIKIQDLKQFIRENKETLQIVIQAKTSFQPLRCTLSLALKDFRRELIQLRDYRTFTEEDLIAVHLMLRKNLNKFVVDPLLGHKVLYGGPFRPSIHFALNHAVAEHKDASWEGTDLALVAPFQGLIRLNPETIYGGTTVDFFFVGYVKLPKNITLLERMPGESWESFERRINEKIYELGYKVMPGGEWNWSAGGLYDVQGWWIDLAKGRWETAPHFNTEFRKIEMWAERQESNGRSLSQISLKEGSLFYRTYFLQQLQTAHPELHTRFKRQLNAWDTYWAKKLE